MKLHLFIATALALSAAHGATFAAEVPPTTAAAALQSRAQAHADRMRLIGRTPVPGEQPAPSLADSDDSVLQSIAQRQQVHVKRMMLIGRTVEFNEMPASPVTEDWPAVTYAERVQRHEQRMKLIGLTAQQNTLPDSLSFGVEPTGDQFSAKSVTASSSTR